MDGNSPNLVEDIILNIQEAEQTQEDKPKEPWQDP